MRVVSETYSSLVDVGTGAEFVPFLNVEDGVYQGVAEVGEAAAELLAEREGFRVVGDVEWQRLTTAPVAPPTAPPPAPACRRAAKER